jgi:predicted phage tail protein
MRLAPATALAAACCSFLTGCGYVGDPMYPSLNIPVRIMDLRVVQRANTLVIDFTIPSLTTDGVVVKSVQGVELRAGDKEVPVQKNQPGPVHVQTSIAGLLGQDALVHVRLINAKGHASEWSNPVTVAVVAPPAAPADLKAINDPAGVKLIWNAPGESHFRIFRRAPDDKTALQIAESDAPEYLDKSTVYGKTYIYSVQALNGNAESEKSSTDAITPKDEFAPAVPTGLTASPGINTVELAWDRNTETDFKGYRLYRSTDNGAFERIADSLEGPSFSDKSIQAGKHYRYTVSAVDQTGNESSRSAPVEITP